MKDTLAHYHNRDNSQKTQNVTYIYTRFIQTIYIFNNIQNEFFLSVTINDCYAV